MQVVDSREMHEHAEGHVPGSLNIPHMATLTRAGDLGGDRPILFICKSGQHSAVAAEFAVTLGFTDLYNVEGGHDDWAGADYPWRRRPSCRSRDVVYRREAGTAPPMSPYGQA